jgi:hypothetical protein
MTMNQIILKHPLLTSIIGLFLMGQAYAGAQLWTFSAPNPSSVTVSPQGTATVQYTVTNQSNKPKNLILKPTLGLSASPCLLTTKGSTCNLTITVTGSQVPAGGIHSGPILCEACKGNPNLNPCSQPSPGNQLNISVSSAFTIGGTVSGLISNGLILQNNGTDNLSISANATTFQFSTPVATGGNYNVTVLQQPVGQFCSVSNGSGSNVMSNINNVVVSCRNLFGYVSDYTNTLWQCPMDLTTGGFGGSCTALTNTPPFEGTFTVTFATFSGNTFAYVSDSNNILWQCPVNMSTGDFSGSCVALTNSPGFAYTTAVTFETFSGNTYAYVSDFSSTLWQCPVDTTTGGFSGSCTALTNTPAFGLTGNTVFKTFSGQTFAYVADDNDAILWRCPVNTTTGGFTGSCTALTNVPDFGFVSAIDFETFSGNTYVYISNFSPNLWQCPIDTTTGDFSGPCTMMPVPASPVFGVVYTTFGTFSGNTYAYIGDFTNPMLWQCPIDTTSGAFSGSCIALTNTPPFVQTSSVTFN